MAVRPPSDAIVALRGVGRRWRAIFSGLGEDESPDALAHRPGGDGRSALDHATFATRTISLLDRALEQILVDDDAALHPAVTDPAQREWPSVDQGVDAVIDELADTAARLADRADRVSAGDWGRRSAVAGGGEVDALAVLWDAVDTTVAELRAAEATVREVRGRP
jgi:hypothetical protein